MHVHDKVEFGEELAVLLLDAGYYPDSLRCANIILSLDKSNKICMGVKDEIIHDHILAGSCVPNDIVTPAAIAEHRTRHGQQFKSSIKPKKYFAHGIDTSLPPHILQVKPSSTFFSFASNLIEHFSLLYQTSLIEPNIFESEIDESSNVTCLSKVEIIMTEAEPVPAPVINEQMELIATTVVEVATPEKMDANASKKKRNAEDDSTRSSNRVKQKLDDFERPVGYLADDISEINPYLPCDLRFQESGPCRAVCEHSNYWRTLVAQLQQASSRKGRFKRRKARKITLKPVGDSSLEGSAFFTDQSLFKTFLASLSERAANINDVVASLLLYIVQNDSDVQWSTNQQDVAFSLMQILGQYTSTLDDILNFDSRYFSTPVDQLSVFEANFSSCSQLLK